MGFTLTARAEEDLIDIWTYIAADNPAAADRVIDRIEDMFGRVATNPQLGQARTDLAEGLRYSVSGSYRCFIVRLEPMLRSYASFMVRATFPVSFVRHPPKAAPPPPVARSAKPAPAAAGG